MKGFGCVFLLWTLVVLAFWGGVVFVAVHFLSKYW